MTKTFTVTRAEMDQLLVDAAAAMATALRQADQEMRARGYKRIGYWGDEILYEKKASTPPGR